MKRILVIEDHPLMRRNIVLILQRENFEVEAAENGRIGIDIARLNPPDLILCDIMMPEMDGYEVLRILRSDGVTACIPFVFLTAKTDRVDQRAGMNSGADDYLTKPVTRDELLSAVDARLKRFELEEQRRHARNRELQGKPSFDSPAPLEKLGLSPREAEVLLWLSQGKSNGDIAVILNISEFTVKKHITHIFEALGVESRHAAALRALEVLT